jgi:hypothetical protein
MSDSEFWKRQYDEINRSHGGFNPGSPRHQEVRRAYEQSSGLSGVRYGYRRQTPGHASTCNCPHCLPHDR